MNAPHFHLRSGVHSSIPHLERGVTQCILAAAATTDCLSHPVALQWHSADMTVTGEGIFGDDDGDFQFTSSVGNWRGMEGRRGNL